MPSKGVILIATGGGLGRLPKAPGTWASLGLVLVFAGVSRFLPPVLQSVLAVILFLVGIWSAERYAAAQEEKDPKEIVIDEITGQWLTLAGFEATVANLALGFILFRLFDIFKPLPIRLGEKLPGGLGIMMDDVLAGIAARFTLEIINRFLLS
ncbi:MAG TPA: phosphatidylglycerophosphatase A [Thermodesulfatator atlanticus]|uniref:Phosphatidylglycerophosphatase A n=1 Tax=Thermodesulfatator atlanticus TaxID=501497 RepID=A0A7V5P1K9_9BACT|nr:phosphatidylglycerophosphatase A [Thermodesulfatator atlanticus]